MRLPWVVGRYNAEGKRIGLNKHSAFLSTREVSPSKILPGDDKEGLGKITWPSVNQSQTEHFEMLLTA